MSTENQGCLAALFGIKSKNTQPNAEARPGVLPYGLRKQFLSAAEASFYRSLVEAIKDKLLVFPKPSLKEFISVTDQNNFQTHLNKIDRKHVDFLICDLKTLEPVFAIELDDASHRRAERGQRDTFLETVLSGVELPLVRVPVRPSYNLQELQILFENAVEKRRMRVAAQEDAKHLLNAQGDAPLCPTHRIPMVLRTARQGNTPGEKFWGCPNFPSCRETIKFQ